ncbi:MAG: DUF885 domain-containing protein [Acidobacteriaceae bacterium]
MSRASRTVLALLCLSTFQYAGAAVDFRCVVRSGEPFLEQANRFLLAGLRYQPVEATQAGYHGEANAPLDMELDDSSPATIAAQRALLLTGQRCFATIKVLNPEDAADLVLLRSNIESSLFSLDVLQGYRYRPQDYVEMIGSGLFFPLTSTSGTEEARLTAVVARMEKIPRILEEARQNVKEADPIFIDTALQENEGNLGVIEQIGSMIPAGSPLMGRYTTASKAARAALEGYAAWLKSDLAHRPHTVTWRTGSANYAKIFAFALGPGTHQSPDSVLAGAERDLQNVRQQMYAVAVPLHRQWFPEHKNHEDLTGDALENKVITEVIDRINQDHVAPGELLEKVKAQAGGIRNLILQKDLLTLSDRDNMRIVPTPVFLRGVYSVAGFHPAPLFEPAQEAEYWVTPIDPKTPKEQAESRLEEYNNWMLLYLTMHEALPGHYTQFEHADNLRPVSRRVLRVLLGNNPYIEGWGEYAVKEMEDAGYANHDPRFVLMVQKIRLRVIANAILDIGLQSRNMTDQEALDLMEKKAFQTQAEAQGKLRRAKLTAGQLITYYVGYHQWIDLRDRLEQEQGGAFSLKRFNDTALDEGPLPIPILQPLLTHRLLGH